MKIGVYAIRDQKFSFGVPMTFANDQLALRDFDMRCHNSNFEMGYKPTDFDLYKIGEYDTESAEIKPVWPVEFIVNGGSVV